LEQAIALDPSFALANAELGRGYVLTYFYAPDAVVVLEKKANAAIQLALRIDPDLPEAHLAASYYHWTPSQRWNHLKAMEECRTALQLSPHWEDAYHQMTLIHLHVGFFPEAQVLASRIVENGGVEGNSGQIAVEFRA
jgi:hypothetical protein